MMAEDSVAETEVVTVAEMEEAAVETAADSVVDSAVDSVAKTEVVKVEGLAEDLEGDSVEVVVERSHCRAGTQTLGQRYRSTSGIRCS